MYLSRNISLMMLGWVVFILLHWNNVGQLNRKCHSKRVLLLTFKLFPWLPHSYTDEEKNEHHSKKYNNWYCYCYGDDSCLVAFYCTSQNPQLDIPPIKIIKYQHVLKIGYISKEGYVSEVNPLLISLIKVILNTIC